MHGPWNLRDHQSRGLNARRMHGAIERTRTKFVKIIDTAAPDAVAVETTTTWCYGGGKGEWGHELEISKIKDWSLAVRL